MGGGLIFAVGSGGGSLFEGGAYSREGLINLSAKYSKVYARKYRNLRVLMKNSYAKI